MDGSTRAGLEEIGDYKESTLFYLCNDRVCSNKSAYFVDICGHNDEKRQRANRKMGNTTTGHASW